MMTPSRSKNTALVMSSTEWDGIPFGNYLHACLSVKRNSRFQLSASVLQLRRGSNMRIQKSCLGKTLVKGLGLGIVFGCPNVDEHSILFESKTPVTQKTGEYLLFQAGWFVLNVVENVPIEYVNTAVDNAGFRDPHFFAEAHDAIFRANVDSPIPRGVRLPAHRNTGQATMFT